MPLMYKYATGCSSRPNMSLCRRLISTIRACIVGAGPAGYYTAQRLLKVSEDIQVDIMDKLPVPFGLVRFGVAPDHPEVKNVIHTFTQTATKYADRCTFTGNVEVGRDVTVSQLLRCYDIVVLSYGAENDRKLGICGEESKAVYSAREFVGWYNGLPEFSKLPVDLSNKKRAVILGQGNVALDIARLLLTPIDTLAKTDICQHSLDVIAASKLESVCVVGRRGPLQAAFTIKELREMSKLPGVRSLVSPEDVRGITIADLPRPRRRLTELMLKMAADSPSTDCLKSWQLKFLLTPKDIVTSGNSVTAVRFIKNKLVGEDIESQKTVQTDELENVPCDMVVRSIGYRSLAIAESDTVPFDESTCTIPNEGGRVVGREGLYCSGWVKRGPVGVLATTMIDAFETADTVLEDLKSERIKSADTERGGLSGILPLSGKHTVNFPEWEQIDREEVERGERKGKPREKIIDVSEMIEVAKR